MPRIAVAGFQHETNTFAPVRADLAAFETADSWPALLAGEDVEPGTRGLNLPVAGFLAAARVAGVETVPILWCAAEPSAHVTTHAFDTIADRILDGIAAAGPVDAVYLDLHGAMVTERHDDGEAELLRRLRARFGRDLPVGVSLDLHANVSAAFLDLVDTVTVYRTYPHLDMAETGARCLPRLLRVIGGTRPVLALRSAPYLIPLHAQYTGAGPIAALYDRLPGPDADHHAEIALGFTAADVPFCGPSVIVEAADVATAGARADALARALAEAEAGIDAALPEAAEAVARAMDQVRATGGPVVIADVQDNPGAGGTGDTTGLLHALVDARAEDAVVALLADPATAARAHAAGVGGVIDGPIGGGTPGYSPPLNARARVEALTDGQARFTGAMYGGGTAVLGPSALLRIEGTGIHLCVTSQRSQCLDLGLIAHFGLDPRAAGILCVKSTVHYRADFDTIATRTIPAAAPGAFGCRLDTVAYHNLRPGARLGPLGRAFGG